MIKLLNSCILKGEGVFRVKLLSQEEFVKKLKNKKFISFIGYEATAKFLEKILNTPIQLNRNETTFEKGDIWMFIRVKYRVDPKLKGRLDPRPEDYEFGMIERVEND